MTNFHELETARLTFKKVTPNVIHALFDTQTKETIMAFFGADESGYEHLKTMHEQGMETHRISLCYFLLVDKQTGNVIGECGFHSWNQSHRRAELFYNLKNDADKRKGLMSEAVTEVLRFGFDTMELHRIAALTANGNMASIRLLERFGFTKEGTLREDYVVDGKNEDSESYSLLQWEWKTANGA